MMTPVLREQVAELLKQADESLAHSVSDHRSDEVSYLYTAIGSLIEAIRLLLLAESAS